MESEKILREIADRMGKPGTAPAIDALVETALAGGIPARDILEQGLIAGMRGCVKKFPHVLWGAYAMDRALLRLRPGLAGAGKPRRGVIGTVPGDLHSAGKDVVRMMIAAQGFEMIDLGVDCAPAAFVSAVRDSGAELVCLSSLLPTTMGAFREIILALERAGLRDTVTVMVGGPLVTGEFAAGIGADAWAPDAVSAAEYCRLL